jgi:hypothetical protein
MDARRTAGHGPLSRNMLRCDPINCYANVVVVDAVSVTCELCCQLMVMQLSSKCSVLRCIDTTFGCRAVNVLLEEVLFLLGNECRSSQMMLLLMLSSECCTARQCYSFRRVVNAVLMKLLPLLLSRECCREPINQPANQRANWGPRKLAFLGLLSHSCINRNDYLSRLYTLTWVK